MKPPSKRVYKLIRDAAGEAYGRELSAELGKLEEDFARWRRGEITPFELTDRIHKFHKGPQRDLYLLYTGRDQQFALARAVFRGHMKPEDLHPDVVEHVLELVQVLKNLDRMEEEAADDPDE